MRKQFIAATIALLAVAMAAGPARATDHVYISSPGEGLPPGRPYIVPVLVIAEGDTVTYRNFDIARHDVRSRAIGPDRPWCGQFPLSYGPGQCPLFASALIGLGGQSPVRGLEDIFVPDGERSISYPFFCTLHSWMQGTLVVVDPALT